MIMTVYYQMHWNHSLKKYMFSISCRNSLFLFSNNNQNQFQSIYKNRTLRAHVKIKNKICHFLLNPSSLSSPHSSQFMKTFSWTGHSIRSSWARSVQSDNIFYFENKSFDKLKILRTFFSSHFSWKGVKGYLTRAPWIFLCVLFGHERTFLWTISPRRLLPLTGSSELRLIP